MGTWNIGHQWGAVDEGTAWTTIRTAFDQGMNMFDTSESYGLPSGLCEERLGVGLAGIRHRVFVVSKIGHWGKRTGQGVPKTTVDMIRVCAHASLHRLRTDYHDVLLCHEHDIEDPSVYLEAFADLRRAGKVREYGISTDDLEVLKRFNHDGSCKVVQIEYSLVNRAAEEGILPYCQAHGIAVMVRGPLAKGVLSGKYTKDSVFEDDVRSDYNIGGEGRAEFERMVGKVAALEEAIPPGEDLLSSALKYTISHAANPVAIPGAKTPQQAIANAAAGSDTLREPELERLKV